MIVLHSSCVDWNCNHDDDHRHHHDKDNSDRDEMALLMEIECIGRLSDSEQENDD